MPIELQFSLTFQDYVDAQILHGKRSIWSRAMRFFWRILFPVTGVIFIMLGILALKSDGFSGSNLFLVLWGLLLIAYPFYVRWCWKRCYRRTRMGPEDDLHVIILHEDKISITASNTKSEFTWQVVKSCLENDKTILLYVAPAKFILLPKRAIRENDLNRLHDLIQASIPQRAA
jgi:YcxB-like protein